MPPELEAALEAERQDEQEVFEPPAFETAADATPEPFSDSDEMPDVEAPMLADATDAAFEAAAETELAQATRRSVDENVLAVLREEAEHEAAVRRAETPSGVETQPELGLAAPANAAAASAAARHISRLKGVDPDQPPAEPAKPAARRDLLPNIEEINSTLRASNDRRGAPSVGDEIAIPKPARGGFRSGFVLMLVIAVLLVLTYSTAPKLAEQMPAAAPTLTRYVAAVDAGRVWADSAMKGAIGMLQDVSSSGN